ncbi:NAD(P)/FAD-dependent oxidoreductase [Gryllotalpicola protaetiae]|uniref:FAD-dependent oxidoreductase n=1 Tax=Gryllotalpicola protaetiae TaxID=2419771 RepID=A0A387BN47_9MICO|nr:FAD-dependent oxidoreductase [Gryllotalpicola protaetiae]AYG02417.1 FAD-dependent oxidoreductase [Gryllotalpicola protaetiae]
MRNPLFGRGSDIVFERQAPEPGVISHALEGTEHRVFWLDDARDRTVYPTLSAWLDVDLAVVGGGYLGLWSAIKAKQRNPDARVALLEGQTIGWAASGRNGGFVEASLTHGEVNGGNRWPKELDTLNRLGLENLEAMERAVAELGLDCEWEHNGSIDVALEEHQLGWIEPSKAGFLDQSAVQAEVHSPTYLGGRPYRDTALVHPAKLAKELARVAASLGVEVFENSLVDELYDENGAVTLTTARAGVRAAQVVLATNAFSPLLKRYRLYTVPVYDYVLMTEPLSAEQSASIGWQGRQGMADLANQFHYYRLTADNRILFGGYDAIYHFGRDVHVSYEERDETFRTLASHFFTTFPQLEGLRFTHRWAGAIDTSSQFCAFYGLDLGGRVATAAGFTGLGVGATHFAAEVLLDRLAGLTTERTELEMVRRKPLPFPPEPFAMAGIAATRWAMDRADHNYGRRNLLLKTLDAMGLGFDS